MDLFVKQSYSLKNMGDKKPGVPYTSSPIIYATVTIGGIYGTKYVYWVEFGGGDFFAIKRHPEHCPEKDELVGNGNWECNYCSQVKKCEFIKEFRSIPEALQACLLYQHARNNGLFPNY